MGDIRNPKTSHQFVDTNIGSSVWIGGNEAAAASIVGQEFADITGGTGINFAQLDDILSAALTSRGWSDAPGLEGVEIVSLSTDSFTIALDGAGGSKDYYTFTGDVAESAIASISGGNIDIKDNKSQVAIFDTDNMSSIWIGGNKSVASSQVGQEFADITGGSGISVAEVGDLLEAATSGSSWNDPSQHGLEGVEILTLTDDEFAFTFEAAAATRDTIIVTGDNAKTAIMDAAGTGVNIKDNKTDLGYWDVAESANFFTGGSGATWGDRVSEEIRVLVDGNNLQKDDVLKIFEAITSGGSWGNPGSNGLDGVELVGMDNDSFTIGLKNGVAIDYIIIDNVHTLDGADGFGFFADDLAIV